MQKKYEMDGYNLYTFETDRFKTIGIKVNIRIDNVRDNARYVGMLWRMLVSTSYKYNSLKEINEACAEIYDPMYNVRTVTSGSQTILSLSGNFANEKYTEKGMNEASFKFLFDVIFKPKIKDGKFDDKVFKMKKKKLIDYYVSLKDYPREYAEHRIEEEMDIYDFEEMSLNELISEIKSLTNKELYDFYKNMINEGKLDIFVCGNFASYDIKKIISKILKFKGNTDTKNHIVEQKKYNRKPNIVIEKDDNVQSNLVIGCKCINISNFERNYVFVLYSWILGGGFNSLLHQSVREKHSLCYYVYAARRILTGVMNIYAGIDGVNFEKTYDLIKKNMDKMKKGDFSLDLFEGVKKIYYSSLVSLMDNQDEILDNYIFKIYTNGDDLKTRKKMMEKVTIDDIMNFAKKVHIDTVYLLKGDEA